MPYIFMIITAQQFALLHFSYSYFKLLLYARPLGYSIIPMNIQSEINRNYIISNQFYGKGIQNSCIQEYQKNDDICSTKKREKKVFELFSNSI